MADRYIFDKRVIKRNVIKYGLALLIALPLVIWLNTLMVEISTVAVIFIDIAIFGVVILICTLICDKIQKIRGGKNGDKDPK